MTTIWFDMDGTIADLYGVNGWLDYLLAADTKPYEIAKPLLRFSVLARLLNQLQRKGYNLGVISWTSKSGTEAYNAEIAAAKLAWLAKHLPSVHFDEIHIVNYGTPKENFAKSNNDILFDDETPNRNRWTGIAHDVDNIIEVLKAL